jgi:hypothetical protein
LVRPTGMWPKDKDLKANLHFWRGLLAALSGTGVSPVFSSPPVDGRDARPWSLDIPPSSFGRLERAQVNVQTPLLTKHCSKAHPDTPIPGSPLPPQTSQFAHQPSPVRRDVGSQAAERLNRFSESRRGFTA